MPANMENSAVATGLGKVSFHSDPKEGQCHRISNFHPTVLIWQAGKVTLEILQTRLQQYVIHECPDVQAGFRKGTEPEIKLSDSVGSHKKQEDSPQNIYFCFIDYTKEYLLEKG